jgi:hypothetical protein
MEVGLRILSFHFCIALKRDLFTSAFSEDGIGKCAYGPFSEFNMSEWKMRHYLLRCAHTIRFLDSSNIFHSLWLLNRPWHVILN